MKDDIGICPMIFDGNEVFECMSTDCEWWDSEYDGCSLRVLSSSLDNISVNLAKIVMRLGELLVFSEKLDDIYSAIAG